MFYVLSQNREKLYNMTDTLRGSDMKKHTIIGRTGKGQKERGNRPPHAAGTRRLRGGNSGDTPQKRTV